MQIRFYKSKLKEAEGLIGEIDRKDVDILALALFTKAPLWSHDRDFEDIKGIELLKTKDFL
ncbi:MAG: PIN domain-containing protein [bacterium]